MSHESDSASPSPAPVPDEATLAHPADHSLADRPLPARPIEVFNTAVPPTLVTMAGFTWRALVVGAGILALLFLLNLAVPVVMAIFFALIVTALAGPVVRRLDRFMPHSLAVVLTLLAMALVVIGVLAFVIGSIVGEWPSLVTALQDGFAQIEQWLKNGPLHWSDAQVSQSVTTVEHGLTGVAGNALSSLGGAFDLITAGSVFLFGAFFFLGSGPQIWAWAVSWFPARVRREADDAGRLGWQTLSGYTRGIIIVAFCDALLVFIGLEFLRIPLAPVLAVVVFFGALIPVIGAPVATLLAAVVALATEGPVKALLVVALTVVIGSFDGDILQPLIMGRAVSLHPLAIVTLIAVGGISFGILGALIAVPVGATVYVVVKYLTGRIPPPGQEVAPTTDDPWGDGRHHWWQRRWNRGTSMDAAAPPG